MLKRFLPGISVGFFALFIINYGCTKLDTTNLGVDIIPTVDNVTTFADTIDIVSNQRVFPDSTKIGSLEDHVLGFISNDPLFGQSVANIFFQLKPNSYPYYFGNAGDTVKGLPDVGIDSVVLCLAYKGAWGDTTIPQFLEVRKLADATFDSPYLRRPISYQPSFAGSTVIGTKMLDLRTMNDKIYFAHGTDSVTNQIRIKLSDTFRDELFSKDTSVTNFTSNAFRSDSLYRNWLKGISVTSVSGNALMYTNLNDDKTRLEIHYRKRLKNNTTNKPDTVYSTFRLLTGTSASFAPSATTNYLVRNRTLAADTGTATEHYLQATPGTSINLNIPELSNMENRIVHKASIIIEQKPFDFLTDSLFSPPSYLYLELKDTSNSTAKWKPVYYDLNPAQFYDPDFKIGQYFPSGGVDFAYFGGYGRRKINAIGETVIFYDINVSRYVQQVLSKGVINYPMRLSAPYSIVYPQYSPEAIRYYNPIGYGRIRLRSPGDPNPNLRMRMVMIYSKL